MQISYHSTLTKIQRLQNLKKKKKNFFLYRSVRPVPADITRNWPVRPVFFSIRIRRGYMYRFACQYSIYWPYQPVRYEIDSLGENARKIANLYIFKSWSVVVIVATLLLCYISGQVIHLFLTVLLTLHLHFLQHFSLTFTFLSSHYSIP